MVRRSGLKISATAGTQGLIDAINKLEGAINNTASYLFADNEVPGGEVDSANKVFTLAHTPDPTLSLRLIQNKTYETPGGEDYTLSGHTITFVNAPIDGSVLRAFYRYK